MLSIFVSLITRISIFFTTRNLKESNLFRTEFIFRWAITRPFSLFLPFLVDFDRPYYFPGVTIHSWIDLIQMYFLGCLYYTHY